MTRRCHVCGTTDRTKFHHAERSRCIACRRAYDAGRDYRRSHVTRKRGHTIGGHWYGFVHLCPGDRTCPVLDVLMRQFIREQQP